MRDRTLRFVEDGFVGFGRSQLIVKVIHLDDTFCTARVVLNGVERGYLVRSRALIPRVRLGLPLDDLLRRNKRQSSRLGGV